MSVAARRMRVRQRNNGEREAAADAAVQRLCVWRRNQDSERSGGTMMADEAVRW